MLVVSALPETVTEAERFGYRFSMSYDEFYTSSTQRETTVEESGCGCNNQGSGGLGWLALSLGLTVVRRRSVPHAGEHPCVAP